MASNLLPMSPSGDTPGLKLQEIMQRQRLGHGAKSVCDWDGDDLASHYSAVSEDERNPPKVREAAMLFSIAEEHLHDGEAEKADLRASDALQLFREINDAKGIHDALRVRNSAYRLRNQAGYAKEQATEELERYKASGDKRGQACMLLSIAEVHHADYKASAALTCLEEAMDLFKAVGDKKMEATTQLAIIDAKMQQFAPISDMHPMTRNAMTLAQEADDKACEARAWLSTANVCIEASNLVEAQQAADAAMQLFQEVGNPKMEAAALELWAVVLIEKEEFRNATEKAKRALKLCEEIGYLRGQASALRLLVAAYIERGELKKAQELAQQGLAAFMAKEDKLGMAAAHCAMAHVHSARHAPQLALDEESREISILEQYPQHKRDLASALLMYSALSVQRRSLADASTQASTAKGIFVEVGDKKGEGIALYAQIFPALLDNNLPAAFDAISDALSVFQEVMDKRWEARTLEVASFAHMLASQHDDMQEKRTRSRSLFEEMEDNKGVAVSLLVQTDMLLESRDYPEALRVSDAALKVCVAAGYKKGEAYALQRTAMACMGKANFLAAVKSLESARDLCKSIEDKHGETTMQIMLSYAHLVCAIQADKQMRVAGSNDTLRKEPAQVFAASKKQALAAAKSARCLAQWMGDKEQHGYASFHAAQAAILCQKRQLAQEYAVDAQVDFDQVGDHAGQAHALITRAEVIMMEDPSGQKLASASVDEARSFGTEALQLSREVQDADAEDRAIRLLTMIRTNTGKATGIPHIDYHVPQQTVPAEGGASKAPPKKSLDPAWVQKIVTRTTMDALAAQEELHMDSPLAEAGIDSLSSVSFRNALNNELGLNFGAALMYDYPTQRALIGHIMQQ